MKHLSIAAVAFFLAVGSAHAQHHTSMPGMDKKSDMDMSMMTPGKDDTAATKGYKSAMMSMMHGMPKFTGNADIDFMKQMRPHHQAAIDMAKVLLANGKDADTKKLAQEIIAAQESEIAMIDSWLKKNGS